MIATAQPRAIVYVRVSGRGQEDNHSRKTQEDGIRAYCAERGYAAGELVSDVHTGDDLFTRPGMKRVRDAMAQGEVDVIVAHALDRLGRRQTHLGLLYSEADHYGVAIEFVTETLEDTPEGRLLQSVRAFAAEIERLKLIERTGRGRRARVTDDGRLLPGPRPPYGYRWVEEPHPRTRLPMKTRLEPDPATAPVVRRMFADLVDGVSAQRVATALTAEGIPTPGGAASWSRQTVAKIVKHPVYTGEARAFRWTWTKEGAQRRGRRTEAGEQVVLAGAAPALVAPEAAAAAAARLAANKKTSTRNNRDPEASLLRGGHVRCGYCGRPMTVRRHSQSGSVLYVCNQWNRERHGCPGHGIAASVLDPKVWAGVKARLLDRDLIAREADRLLRDDPTRLDRTALDRRAAELERTQSNLRRELAREDNPDVAALIRADLAQLAGEQRGLNAERQELDRQRQGWEEAQRRLADLDAWMASARLQLDDADADYARKRTALHVCRVTVRVWGTDHTPRWDGEMHLGDGATVPIVDPSSCRCSQNSVLVLRWTDRDDPAALAAD